MTYKFRSKDNKSLSNKSQKIFSGALNNISNFVSLPELRDEQEKRKVQDVSTSKLLTEIDNTERKVTVKYLKVAAFTSTKRRWNDEEKIKFSVPAKCRDEY
jgi:hypothetical protein